MSVLNFLDGLAKTATPFTKPIELARMVSDLAMRRRLDAELEAARERLCTREQPIMSCISDVIAATGEAAIRAAKAKGYLSLGDAVDGVMQKAEGALNGIKPPAIRTGLTRLDDMTGGFHAGDLIVIAGRPGMGKTILLSAVCRAAAQASAPALLIELEMPRDQIIQRGICDMDYDEVYPRGGGGPLPFTRFRSGKFTGDEFDRAARAAERFKRLNIEIFDNGGSTIHEIAALAERFTSKCKTMGVIAIDYLQIVAPSDRYRGSKVQEVTEISNGAKALAKRIGWPVVVGCQLNRGIEGRDVKRPRLGDLRESGAIEQDADIVLGLYRKGYYLEEDRPEYGPSDARWLAWKSEYDAVRNDLDISVLKNRNGATGLVKCHVEVSASAIRNRREDMQTLVSSEGYAH